MGTVSPSGTTISARTPATGAGISESTLSVLISRSDSSTAMRSPGAFSQAVMVPSVTVSPICGIRTSTDAATAGSVMVGYPLVPGVPTREPYPSPPPRPAGGSGTTGEAVPPPP